MKRKRPAAINVSPARSEEGQMLLEVSPAAAEAVLDTVILFGAAPVEAVAAMKRHKVTVGGKPAGGQAISLRRWKTRCEWIMATPRAGDYVVSLFMISGDKRPGKFGFYSGATKIESGEFRQKGDWAGCVKAFRITPPPGQKLTKMFLAGDGISLRRVDISPVGRLIENPAGRIRQVAESSYRTVLRAAGERAIAPSCRILAPSEGVEARLARGLANALKVGLAAEPEPTEPFPQNPALRDGNADTNLILLSAGTGGPLVKALRRAGLIAENRAIPGRGGYAIRTVARPFNGRANVIVISGGDDDGLAKGVNAFLPLPDAETGDLVWDRFLVESPGERWARVRPSFYRCADDDPIWARKLAELRQPFAGASGEAPGRSFIGQTAEVGNQYWLTGKSRFAELFKQRMFKMENDDIYGGSQGADSHMELYGLVRAWDRVEESPVFTMADRLRITNYLLHRCVLGNEGFLRAYDGGGPEYGPYSGAVRMRHNHQTVLACGLMQAYLYFHRLYGLGYAEIWKSWCDDVMNEATFWGHAPENSPNYEPRTFIETANMFHYQGLSAGGRESTRSWPDAASRLMCARDSFGLPACYGDCWDNAEYASLDFFAVMRDDFAWPQAQFLIDRVIRGYRYANPESPAAGEPYVFMTNPKWPAAGELYAYLNGSTEVGGVLPPPRPAADTAFQKMIGLRALPMTEGYWRYMTGQVGHKEFWDQHGRREPIPYRNTADKVVYRSGWEVGDEYMLLETLGWADHGHMDLGAIVQYCHGGRLWIVDAGYNNTGPEHHSTLEVKRDGKPAWGYFKGQSGRWGDFRAGPQMFEIVELEPDNRTEDKPGIRAFRVVCRAKDLAGATWQRALCGGESKGLRIEDTLTAQEPDEYQIVFRLRLLGRVEGGNGQWQVRQKGALLPVALEFQEGDVAGVAAWVPDSDAHLGGSYSWYPFIEGLAKPGEPESGAPRTIEWKRAVRLDRGQSAVFRAALGPSEKAD